MFLPQAPVKQLDADDVKLSAWVEVDGVKVDIFGAKAQDGVHSGFIESTVGKEFVLCFEMKMTKPSKDMCGRGWVDGIEFTGRLWPTHKRAFQHPAGHSSRIGRMEGTSISKYEVQKNKWVELKFTNDSSRACRNVDILNNIGTIKLDFSYGKEGKVIVNPRYLKGPVDQSPIHQAHQPDLDMTERTAPGLIQQTKGHSSAHWTPAEKTAGGKEKTFATFEFYYRSGDILWRNGLVQTPTLLSSRPSSPFANKESPEGKLYSQFMDGLFKLNKNVAAFPIFV